MIPRFLCSLLYPHPHSRCLVQRRRPLAGDEEDVVGSRAGQSSVGGRLGALTAGFRGSQGPEKGQTISKITHRESHSWAPSIQWQEEGPRGHCPPTFSWDRPETAHFLWDIFSERQPGRASRVMRSPRNKVPAVPTLPRRQQGSAFPALLQDTAQVPYPPSPDMGQETRFHRLSRSEDVPVTLRHTDSQSPLCVPHTWPGQSRASLLHSLQ